MAYINSLYLDKYSVSETVPFQVTIDDLDDTMVNTLSTVKRFDTSNSADTGTSIAAEASISGDTVTLTDVWNVGETKVAGTYRIQVIAQGPGATTPVEFNAYVTQI